MPRANRHFLPGHVWHITHRCHKQEYLLKFAIDRACWIQWLYEARRRYEVSVLNYMVTCNHVHLLVQAHASDAISASMRLIAGRTAQEYNRRKSRKGAFWEDRYHATAVQSGEHLFRCLVYIDLNMVRAGVVGHPSEWKHCGYHEIQKPPERYRIIDRKRLREMSAIDSAFSLAALHDKWITSALASKQSWQRDPSWTDSIAVGQQNYVEAMRRELAFRSPGRRSNALEHGYELKEAHSLYRRKQGQNQASKPEIKPILRRKSR